MSKHGPCMSANITVLHVDDEPGLAELTATYLERHDDRLSVETVTSGEDALASLKAGDCQPQCIVSDYDMPGMDGLELLETVRQEFPDLPFVLFTGRGSEEVASEAISVGVSDYLEKESGTEQYELLATRITNLVATRRAKKRADRQENLMRQSEILSSTGGWELDTETDTLYTTTGTRKLCGVAGSSRLHSRRDLIRYIHPDDRSDVRVTMARAERRGTQMQGEWRLQPANGGERQIQMTIEPVADGDGSTLRGAIHDVTELRQREQQLQDERAVTENVLNTIDDIFYLLDAEGQVQRWNRALPRVTGYSDDTLAGMDVDELFSAANREHILQTVSDTDSNRRRVITADIKTQAGEHLSYELTNSRLTDSSGDVVGVVGIGRELTDERQQERIISQYEQIIENLPVGVFRTTIDGKIQHHNTKLASIYDAESRGQMTQLNVSRIYADTTDRTQLLAKLRSEGSLEDERLHVETLDGDSKWVETSLTLVEANGREYIDGTVRNVTEQVKQERALMRAETLFQHAQDMLFVIECHEDTYRVQRVNDSFETTTGLVNTRISGKTPRDIFGDDRGSQIEARYEQCVEQRAPLRYVETIEASKLPADNGFEDTEQTHWETQIAPVEIDGDVRYIVGATRGITQREERKQELERITSEYTTLIENFPGGVFLFDKQLQYVHAGGEELSTVGLSAAEFKKSTPYDVFPSDVAETVASAYRTALDGETTTYEEQLKGEWYRVTAAPVRDETGQVILGMAVAQNITDEKRRRDEIRQENERLEEFARVVSHDLRNPLTVAEGYIELAQQENDSAHLERATDAIARSQTLIDDLLTLARNEHSITETEVVALSEITHQCWKNVETQSATLHRDVERVIQADRGRLKQLLENVYRNAVEHGGEDVTVSVRGLEDGFSITDTGPGIPEEDYQNIFEAGYSTADDGTGFGLRIVKQVVEAHGWEITASNHSHGGACFEITGVEFEES